MKLNPYIVVPLVAWFLAQWTKFTIAAFKDDINFRYLYASGGMPSVHSAVVTSLFMVTWLQEGSSSPLFGITAVFAAIVIYDSLGVRRSTGEQAVVLNAVVASLEQQKVGFSTNVAHVREVLGHKPNEVFWGIVLGTIVALLGNMSQLTKQVAFLLAIPQGVELYAYIAIAVAVLVSMIAALIIYAKRWKHSDNQMGKLLVWLTIVAAISALFLNLVQFEEIAGYGARWILYVNYVVIAYLLYHVVKSVRALPKLRTEVVVDRKTRWLQKSRSKKRKK